MGCTSSISRSKMSSARAQGSSTPINHQHNPWHNFGSCQLVLFQGFCPAGSHTLFFSEVGKKVLEFNLCWKEKGSNFCTDSIYTDGPGTGGVCSGDHCCCSSSHCSATAAAAELASALLKATATEAAGGGPREETGDVERKMNREDGVLSPKRDVNSLLHFTLTTRMRGIWI